MKRGISLIAVLMFMLAATTASVVIFKWIGSENFSSGARLKASEAYQASESGIDYVRSWMENKAVDVGALVTQYYANKPTKSLKIFSDTAVGNKGQKFSAYLIGIDTTSKPVLKLKILVEGNARDNSKVSQTAIFSTDGLYKIFIPAEIQKQKSTTDLNAYFGGSLNFMGDKKFSSATINGDWTGNPLKVDKDFIVTGNLLNSGTGIDIGKNACVGGNYSPDNNEVKIGGGLYIGESVKKTETVNGQPRNTSGFVGNADSYQDVYCEGDMQFGTTGAGDMISGSLTINGRMFGFAGNFKYRIKGDLVLGDRAPDTANIDFRAVNDESFTVCGNVWTKNQAGVKANTAKGEKIMFNYGKTSSNCPSKPSATLFFNNAIRTTATDNLPNLEYKTQPNPPVGYFRSKATSNTPPITSNKPAGADSIKKYCMNILRPLGPGESGCPGSKYKVDDPIATSLDNIKKFLRDSSASTSIKSGDFKCLSNDETKIVSQGIIESQGTANLNSKGYTLPNVLNDCYSKLENSTKLYGGKGGYLIVKLYQQYDYKITTPLKGNFIFIYERSPEYVFILPTTNSSKVMIFFEQGVSGEIRSARCVDNPICNDDNQGGKCKYNYFIYSLQNIRELNEWDKNCPLKGNIFFPSNNCAKVINANNQFSLESNTDLVDELMDMGIICKRKLGNTGYCSDEEIRESKEDPTQEGTTLNPEINDANWIPIAARLPIKLESKEISKEKTPAANENYGKPILIMPRVIYLAPNQISNESELKNYYAALYLNGATNSVPTTSPNCVSISGSSISDFGAKKRYTCSFTGRADISKFYVIIDPNNDVASQSVTARCEWNGRDRTMFKGQSKPSDPIIVCSSGEPSVSWKGLPPNTLTRGTFIPIPDKVTCEGEVPTNSIGISCGILTVKEAPTINACSGVSGQKVTLPNHPTKPTITLSDPDNICSDNNSNTPNADWTNESWKVNRDGSTLTNANWNNLFDASGTKNYDTYRVSGKCGDYGTLEKSCTGSAEVNSGGTTVQSNDCEYNTEWCGGKAFDDVTYNSIDKPRTGNCTFFSDYTDIWTTGSGTNIILINGGSGSGGVTCTGSQQKCAIAAKKDGGYYVYVQSGSISGSKDWKVTTGAKPNCTSINSSATATITCTFVQNSYTATEDISAPTFSCSNGGPLDKSNMSFNFEGISPMSPGDWKNNSSTYYTTTGTSTVKITGAKCGNINVAETACTPSLTITKGCTQLTLNADGIYQTPKTSSTTPDGACYSFPCTGSLEVGYVGGSDKKISVPNCGSGDYTIKSTGSGNFDNPPASIPYTPICPTSGNVQVFLKGNTLSSQTQYMNFKCNSTPAADPTVTCDLGGGTYNIGALIDRPTVSCGTGFIVSGSGMSFSGSDIPNQDNGWNSGSSGKGNYKTSGSKSDITLSSVTCAAISSTATHTVQSTSCTNPFSINAVTCNVAGTNNNKTTFNINENITSPALTNCDNPSNRNYTYQGNSMTNTSNWNTEGGQAQFTSAGAKIVALSSVQCNGVTINNISCSLTIAAGSSSSATPTLSCTGLQATVEKGATIAQPTLTCSNGSTATNANWTGRPQQNGSWTTSTQSTTTSYTIGVTATCGSAGELSASCGTVNVVTGGGGGNNSTLTIASGNWSGATNPSGGTDVSAGTINITCSTPDANLKCWFPSASSVTNGSNTSASPCNQPTTHKCVDFGACKNTTTLTVTGTGVKCQNAY